jgi:hypothetical protein
LHSAAADEWCKCSGYDRSLYQDISKERIPVIFRAKQSKKSEAFTSNMKTLWYIESGDMPVHIHSDTSQKTWVSVTELFIMKKKKLLV